MNVRGVLHLISYMLLVLGIALLVCLGISFLYGDPALAKSALGASTLVAFAVGGVMLATNRTAGTLSRRDGFITVTLGWMFAAAIGALPYVFSGVIQHPISAFFEAMSGFTTTGASVLNDIEAVPKGILFWRAMTHWFGGMGVLVLCVAILPLLGVGGMQIYRAEMPGPSKNRLTPRITSTAKLLWGVYCLLCLAETILLKLTGFTWFDAVCHSFATMATGGFSTLNDSVAGFNNVWSEIVIIIFMFLAGTNFTLHVRALRGKVGNYFHDAEFRFYLGFWLCACLFLSLNTYGNVFNTAGESLRAGFFQATSILTTTGFCTKNFDVWPTASRVVLVLLMFVGGCAGSTGGGIKNVRILVVLKSAVREMRLFMQPSSVVEVKVNKHPLGQGVVSNIAAFFSIFILIFAVGTVAMSFFTPDLETAFSSVAASLCNIGPGLASVGATENYSAIPSPGKMILSGCMLLGRLELFTVLAMFVPGFWKK